MEPPRNPGNPSTRLSAEVVLSVPKLDDALTEEHLASLFLPTGMLADAYTSPSGCGADDCPRCRVGRMLVALSKTHFDAVGVLEVLVAVAPLLREDPEQRDVVNHGDLAVALAEITAALSVLEGAGMNVARAMGQRPKQSQETEEE